MTLEEWRRIEGLSYARLGQMIGVTEETARRYCLPEDHSLARFPDRPRLRTIHRMSGGQVTPNDFLGL